MPFDVMPHSAYLWKFQTQLQSNVYDHAKYAVLYSTAAVVISMSYTQQYRPYINHIKLLLGLSFLYQKSLLSFYH